MYPNWEQRFRVIREIVRVQSPFQEIVIFESASHGRVLMLDGAVQVTEADEFAYQEMIVHVPLIQHGVARRVLIIGAGDGGVLRRVLQHRSVERVVMVEIDEAVIQTVQMHLPTIAMDAWTDARAEIVIGDGVAYVEQAPSDTFDIIIVDSTDPSGPGARLFSETFYIGCSRILSKGGLIVNQCGVPFMQADELTETTILRSRAFAFCRAFLVAVPTYVGGFMTLGLSTQMEWQELPLDIIQNRSLGIVGDTSYWSPSIHQAAFALPPYIARLLDPKRGNDLVP